MKYVVFASWFAFSLSAFAAEKASFSVFGTESKFAEITCTGITGHPGAYTMRLPASQESPQAFETYVDLIDPYKLSITASAAPAGRTLYLMIGREDASPTFASTKGLDLALRIGAGYDVYCELNNGGQKTRD